MQWPKSSRRPKVPYAAGVTVALAAAMLAQPVAGAQALPQGGSQAPETMIVVLSASCPSGGSCPAQAPVISQLQAAGATVLSTTTLVDTITATMSPAEAQAIAGFPGVSQVVPNSTIPLASPVTPAPQYPRVQAPPGGPGSRSQAGQVQACGSQRHPELDPEALTVVNATGAQALGDDGAGVTVALLADGLDPTNPDLQRSPTFGEPGQPVITSYQDFSGDGVNASTDGGEAFLDASSIAAQGNEEYNLADYVAPVQAARMPAGGCWIRVLGVAPGADVMALKVFAQDDNTTGSGFLQAIQYAVDNGAKVINESFGSNSFPDTALDITRDADDAAVAAGVTVVVSSGDAGSTSTIGSPATDPDLISVGATTTFRAYEQDNYGGFDNPAVGNGRFLDDNISALSSGGFTEAGNTVDLVAPGDLNWALCSPDVAMYSGCTSETGAGSPVQLEGGTSESSPLTAAAAADVIEAYAKAHGGNDPSPALVKQILMSSATDLDMPAQEQGAGLLNVRAAVDLAASLPPVSTRGPGNGPSPEGLVGGSLLVGPNQVNFAAAPGTAESQQISVTNTSPTWAHVNLSTRALTREVYDNGAQTFTMNPSSATGNSGNMPIWSGVTEVYQTETFHVPFTNPGEPARLVFNYDYQYTGQTSLLHVALFDPEGTYAGYSLPQGLGDYGQVEVTGPLPGRWTALFFTELDGATTGGVGTSGPVQWDASTWQFAPAGNIRPSSLNVAPGQTATATLSLTTPTTAGDSAQSVVISSDLGQTTVPVTLRSTIALGATGGTFSGVLSGGNGRNAPAQANYYYFDVPAGESDLDASISLANDSGDQLIGYLVDPNGLTVGYSSNYTLLPTSSGLEPGATQFTQLYHIDPIPGQWALALYWANPVTGNELDEPFSGAIEFNQVSVASNLPGSSSTTLPALTSTAFDVDVTNTGVAPEAFFVDPRLDQTTTLTLANQNPNVTATAMTLPQPAPSAAGYYFPYYLVPPQTTQLSASVNLLSGTSPVTFDAEYFPGDPDVSPNQPAPGVTSAVTPTSANLSLTEPSEVSPGFWLVDPDETGPYPATGAPTDTASETVTAVSQAFDPTVTSNTDDLWLASTDASYAFDNVLYLLPGQTGSISVDITPTANANSVVSGTLYVDDFALASAFGDILPNADELAAIPYSYTVGSASP